MKRVRHILASVVFIISIIIAPSTLNAAPIEFSSNGHYYEFIEEALSWSDARDSAISMGGYLATITTSAEAGFIGSNFGVNRYWIGGYQLEGSTEPGNGWQWVTGEAWGSYTNWYPGEPNNSSSYEDFLEVLPFEGVYWNDYPNQMLNYYLVEYDADPSIVEEEAFSTDVEAEQTWVRTMPMTCWQVWINEDNDFQFIFWYLYRDNNWVRIYNMEDNLVFEVDLSINDPNLIVDLPDGFYIVKTFHHDTLLQEFLIGKP